MNEPVRSCASESYCALSMRHWPMPWTTPPWIWPSTRSGFKTVPKSLTELYRTTSTAPVSGSISTSATWQPFGNAEGMTSVTCLTSRAPGFFPASSRIEMPRSVPVTTKRPSRNSISLSAVSSTSPANALPFLITRSEASASAPPPIMAGREPPVPAPNTSSSESFCTRRIFSHRAVFLDRGAEPRAQPLRERRRVPLAVVERAADHGDGTRIASFHFEADATHLLVGRCGDFEVTPEAEAAQIAPRLAFPFSLFKPGDVGCGDGLFEYRSEVAAVVGHGRGGLVGNLLGAHVVAPAQLEAVDAHLGGGLVDEPLHVVVRFRASGAAVGAHRRGVGDHRLGGHLEGRHAVDARDVAHHVHGRRLRRDRADVRADIAMSFDFQS